MNSLKVLSRIVEQFRSNHKGQSPKAIVIAPVALVALGIKHSVSPSWDKIPVECRLFEETEVVTKGTGTKLGVFVYGAEDSLTIRACELP
jgi:hypothetical protein